MNTDTLETLIAKEQIRDLALLYSRGVDRQDAKLLRDLYTDDATDTHGDTFDGSASDYVDFLEQAFPHLQYSGHHICNHLISVDDDRGEGEVYALAYHIFPDGQGGQIEDFMCVRYLDHYRKCEDGRWRFAKRVVTYDLRKQGPVAASLRDPEEPSFALLQSRLFARGKRG
ncbi:nuclear transport factor 2 family protein [Aestuariicella hydrocarbonica]|uniref:Nuclear transport factor 2 family protein n=1 Tax=Pseudomaricurvus hydrocarbonicus TaxID=1470433 RepID=A0A9E5MQB4_9GAMM|nr:nuclear transport factor 2 family protein [Aestuariicella hydrocarbonica]NHO68395.1 nuclear transport factor 2 family protein [Aestuariicella hydrocarbonica]